jgi:hypothetical protein
MRTLLVAALAATTVGCCGPLPPQAGIQVSAGQNPFASLTAVGMPIELGSFSSSSTTTESKSTGAWQSEKPASGHARHAVHLVRTTAKSRVAVKDGAASLVPPPPRSSQIRPQGAGNTTPAASDATRANIADPHPTVGVANTRTIQKQVAAATAVAERMKVENTAAAPDRNTDKVASAPANSTDLLVAVLMTRPDIRSVPELTGKTIAIDDRYSASNSNVRIAIVAAGAPGVQLSEGQITAIDRVISGEVPAAVLTLTSPEAAEGFPEIAGFKIFLIPLSPRLIKGSLPTSPGSGPAQFSQNRTQVGLARLHQILFATPD